MKSKLIFIGVLHGDGRIKKALKKIKPDLISVEMSRVYWNALKKNKQENTFAEISESIKYSKKYRIPLYFNDLEPSKKEINSLINSNTNTDKELSNKKVEQIYMYFKKHYSRWSKETETILIDEGGIFKKRTNYMAKKIEKNIKENSGKLIVHIGGAGHFLKTKRTVTLFTKMHKFRPKKFILTDLL